MNVWANQYEQLCGTCARDRYLSLVHHSKCDVCSNTTLVGITKKVAYEILIGPYE